MDKKDFEELKELCMPIVDYLDDNYNMHCEVVITTSSIELKSTELGIPIKMSNKKVWVDAGLIGATIDLPNEELRTMNKDMRKIPKSPKVVRKLNKK
ncbi:hypothetical protein I7E32_16415 [Alcaligenes faecalis]|nr:hypothetical protein [Alcaligenes faecalis]